MSGIGKFTKAIGSAASKTAKAPKTPKTPSLPKVVKMSNTQAQELKSNTVSRQDFSILRSTSFAADRGDLPLDPNQNQAAYPTYRTHSISQNVASSMPELFPATDPDETDETSNSAENMQNIQDLARDGLAAIDEMDEEFETTNDSEPFLDPKTSKAEKRHLTASTTSTSSVRSKFANEKANSSPPLSFDETPASTSPFGMFSPFGFINKIVNTIQNYRSTKYTVETTNKANIETSSTDSSQSATNAVDSDLLQPATQDPATEFEPRIVNFEELGLEDPENLTDFDEAALLENASFIDSMTHPSQAQTADEIPEISEDDLRIIDELDAAQISEMNELILILEDRIKELEAAPPQQEAAAQQPETLPPNPPEPEPELMFSGLVTLAIQLKTALARAGHQTADSELRIINEAVEKNLTKVPAYNPQKRPAPQPPTQKPVKTEAKIKRRAPQPPIMNQSSSSNQTPSSAPPINTPDPSLQGSVLPAPPLPSAENAIPPAPPLPPQAPPPPPPLPSSVGVDAHPPTSSPSTPPAQKSVIEHSDSASLLSDLLNAVKKREMEGVTIQKIEETIAGFKNEKDEKRHSDMQDSPDSFLLKSMMNRRLRMSYDNDDENDNDNEFDDD